MKKSMVLALALAGVSIVGCEQHENEHEYVVPAVVQNAFQEIFPNISDVEWDKENEKEWEAEFKLDGKEYSANFQSDGTWKETEHEIKKSEIPVAVQNTLNSEFAGYKIEEAEISEKAEGMFYEFELEKGEAEMEVAIDANGKVVKKEVKEEKESGDSDEEDSEDDND